MERKDMILQSVCPSEEEFYKTFGDWKTVKTIPLAKYSFTEEQRSIQEKRLKQMMELLWT